MSHPAQGPPPAARRRRVAWLAAVGLALAAPAWAAPGIRVTVDPTAATLEDRLLLTVTVDGAQNAQPELPPLPDFRIQSRGQSTQMRFINGQMSASVSYTYILFPQRTGTFTIGAARVEVDGRVHTSEPFSVRILEASARPAPSRDLFITATVSDPEPYVGQQIVYTWRFYHRVPVTDPRLEPFSFPGFVVEDLGDVKRYEAVVDGQSYRVSEISKALFPQQQGSLTIPGPALSCGVAVQGRRRGRSLFDEMLGRFETTAKRLSTASITLTVRPLPAPPRGFSGLVGRFDVAAELSKPELAVGESTTLEITISGRGNAQMISEPKLPELAQLKVYAQPPTSSLEATSSGIVGRKRYVKALVPQAPGKLALPPIEVVYFDPASGAYRTAATPRLELEVRPAEGEEELAATALAPNAGKVAVRILADDILPLHRELTAVTPAVGAGAGPALWSIFLAAPPLAFAVLLLARRRHLRYAQDERLRRRRGAGRRARAAARRLEATAASDDPRAASHFASRCLRELVGDKLGLEGAALTPEETAEALRGSGVPPPLVERSRALLTRLEAAQYGADGDGRAAAAELRPLIEELDRYLPA